MVIRILRIMLLTAFLFFQIFQLNGVNIPVNGEDEVLGVYNMKLKGAPYGYEEGTLSIEKIRGLLDSKVELAGAIFSATKTVITGNEVLIDIYIEGIPMKLALQYDDSKLTGKITSTDMNFDVYASKIKKFNQEILGRYNMMVEGAPNGYEKGVLTLSDSGGKVQSEVEIAKTVFRALKTEISGNTVLIMIFIEGLQMEMNLIYEDSRLTGSVSSTDMKFNVKAEKI